MKNLTWNDKLITFIVLFAIPLSQIAIDIYLPSMPAMAKDLNTSNAAIQFTFTFYVIGLSFSQLIYGPLSDRIGRRVVILFGAGLFFAGSIVCSFAHTISLLNFARLAQGIGGGSIFVVTNAILADVFTGERLAKRIVYGSLIWSLIPILAPAAGGFVQEWFGWRANFYIMAFYAITVIIAIAIWMPETCDHSVSKGISAFGIVKRYLKMLINPRFLSFILTAGFSYGPVIAFSVVGPFILENRLHVSASRYGMYVLLVGATYTLGTFLNGQALRRFGYKPLLVFGATVTLLSGGLLLLLSAFSLFNVVTIVGCTCVLQIGQGFIFSNCLSNALSVFPKLGGSASSLFGSFLLFIVTVISAVVARLNVTTQGELSVVYLVLGGLTALSVIPALWPHKKMIKRFL